MKRVAVYLSAIVALTFLAPSQALRAQAFTQEKGEGRVIATAIYTSSDKAFDGDGNTIDIPDYDKLEVYLLGEYGVTDDLTLLLTPSFRSVSIEDGSDSSGLGYTDLGARYRVFQKGNVTFSLQGLARIPGNTQENNFAQIGQTDVEFDFRGQAAATFGSSNFAILEAGYRLRAGDPPDEFHVDATVGVKAADRLWVILNSFNTVSNGRGEGVYEKLRYHNVYLGAAYELTPQVTVQAGVVGTLAGENALRERGGFASLWFKF